MPDQEVDEYGITVPPKDCVEQWGDGAAKRMKHQTPLEQLGTGILSIPALLGAHLIDEASPYGCDGWGMPGGMRTITEANNSGEYIKERTDAENAAKQTEANKDAMATYKDDVKVWRDKECLPDDAEIYQAEADGTSPHVVPDAAGNPQCVAPTDASGGTAYSPYAGQYDDTDLDPSSPADARYSECP